MNNSQRFALAPATIPIADARAMSGVTTDIKYMDKTHDNAGAVSTSPLRTNSWYFTPTSRQLLMPHSGRALSGSAERVARKVCLVTLRARRVVRSQRQPLSAPTRSGCGLIAKFECRTFIGPHPTLLAYFRVIPVGADLD